MIRSKLNTWLLLPILILFINTAIGQEIKIYNLPHDIDYSTLEPHKFKQNGEEKIYITVVFARIEEHYIYLNYKQVADFNNDWVDYYSLVKSPDLLTAINYKGPYRVVVYNIKESKKEKLFEDYL